MINNELNWYIINKEYVEYLKDFDKNVQNIEYKDTNKPYIGTVLFIKGFKYYVPISLAKKKHFCMSENIDFIKIIDNNKTLSVMNLNYMIPVERNNVELLKYERISKYFNFKTETARLKYIALLRREHNILNNRREDILKRAKRLYRIREKFPDANISKRCCDFKLLEQKSKEYKNMNGIK